MNGPFSLDKDNGGPVNEAGRYYVQYYVQFCFERVRQKKELETFQLWIGIASIRAVLCVGPILFAWLGRKKGEDRQKGLQIWNFTSFLSIMVDKECNYTHIHS